MTSEVLGRIGLSFLVCVTTATGLTGCIVQDMRDDLHSTSSQLGEVLGAVGEANRGLAGANELLSATNTRLDSVEQKLAQLERTNNLLDGVQSGMGRVDTTNTRLESLQGQLGLLQSIESSLGRLDTHLGALRKTLGSLDSFVPFIDLTGGEPVEDAPVTNAQDAATPPQPEATQTPTGEAQSAPSKTEETKTESSRDWLVGVWIRTYPDDREALVVLQDGSYVRSTIVAAQGATNGAAPETSIIERGTWVRTGTTLELTPKTTTGTTLPQSGTSPASTGEGSTGGSNPAQGTSDEARASPLTLKGRVLAGSSRALAVESEKGLLIYRRP